MLFPTKIGRRNVPLRQTPSSICTAAARKGAPQAQQVADRFHLLQNVRERLKEVMDRKQDCLPEVEEHASDAIPAKARGRKEQGTHEVAKPQAELEPEKHYRTGSASPN